MKRILLLALPVLALSSCYTDPAPGTGIVIVKDVNDFTVPLVNVHLEQRGQNLTGIISEDFLTDNNGKISYTHTDYNNGMALEVILDITATKGNRQGSGIIRIKPGETTTEVVRITP